MLMVMLAFGTLTASIHHVLTQVDMLVGDIYGKGRDYSKCVFLGNMAFHNR